MAVGLKSKHLGFMFLRAFQLIRMKFNLLLKRLMLNILILLLNDMLESREQLFFIEFIKKQNKTKQSKTKQQQQQTPTSPPPPPPKKKKKKKPKKTKNNNKTKQNKNKTKTNKQKNPKPNQNKTKQTRSQNKQKRKEKKRKKKTKCFGMHSKIYEPIWFKLSMMSDMVELYNVILVLVTMNLIQGPRDTRKGELLYELFHKVLY